MIQVLIIEDKMPNATTVKLGLAVDFVLFVAIGFAVSAIQWYLSGLPQL